jgi:hypothetical protein
MTSATARARRACPTETDLGGQPGFPLDVRIFNPLQTVARLMQEGMTPELIDQVEMGAAFMPRARRGEHSCVLCARPFVGIPARIGTLETPGGTKRALFGACQTCNGPNIERRMIEQLGEETAIN